MIFRSPLIRSLPGAGGRRAGPNSICSLLLVVDEAGDGEPARADERLRFLRDVRLLRVSVEAHALKSELLRRTQIPAKAENDALHIAVAAVQGMEFLATWNCRHIANAVSLPLVYEVCRSEGYEPPIVCTPHELMGEDYEEA
jgi:hypothetical protein